MLDWKLDNEWIGAKKNPECEWYEAVQGTTTFTLATDGGDDGWDLTMEQLLYGRETPPVELGWYATKDAAVAVAQAIADGLARDA